MIFSILLKSYFTTLLSLGAAALFIFVLGIYLLFLNKKPSKNTTKPNSPSNTTFASQDAILRECVVSSDIIAIAGDDVLTTQLDLARAYIESGKAQLAKNILLHVVQSGKGQQQREAQHLLVLLGNE